MGNQQNNDTNLTLSNQQRQNWIKVQDQGYCQLWENKINSIRFQAYPISESSSRDNVQLEKYAFRKMHSAYLVSVQAVINQNQAFLCSEPTTSFVLVENIVNRLRSFKRVFTFQEALYILYCSSTGYNTLSSFFGQLEPNEDLICFNQEGQVKVWLNQNLSKNEVSSNAKINEPITVNTNNEDYTFARRRSRQCVERLLSLVQLSATQGFPKGFEDETKSLCTFFQISNFVDYFCDKNGIKLPEKIEKHRLNPLEASRSAAIPNSNIIYSPRPAPIVNSSHQNHSLQSSRVNRVFQSHHQREIPIPVVIPAQANHPNTYFSYSHPPQVILNSNPNSFPQNHRVSYTYINNRQPVVIPPPTFTHSIHHSVNQISVEHVPVRLTPIEKVNNIQNIQKQEIVVSSPQHEQIVITSQKPQLEVHEEHKQIIENPCLKQQQHHHYEYQHEGKLKESEQKYQFDDYQQKPVFTQQNLQQHHPYQSQAQQQHQPAYLQAVQRIDSPAQYPHQHIPQLPFRQHQVIIQTQQEHSPSPPKKSLQIEQWQQKLNQFTQSKQKPLLRVEEPPIVEPSNEPESFKNLVVSNQTEQYVNELADLQSDDIEKYIRMKYQSYLNQQNNLNQEIQTGPTEERTQGYSYSTNYNEPIRQSEEQSNQYYYQSYLVRQEQREKENRPSYQYEPYPSITNRISIEMELQPSARYSRNDPIRYGSQYEKGLDQINVDQVSNNYYDSKRVSERSRSNRASNIIDQKYSKYVLNPQKQKRPILNINSEDVSLILPADESHFSKQSHRPILQKSIERDLMSRNERSDGKKGITYEKLRNLLWQD